MQLETMWRQCATALVSIDISPLMHSELTCTGTFNADVVEESLFATIICASFLSNPNINDNGEDERKEHLYDSSSRSRFSTKDEFHSVSLRSLLACGWSDQ